MNKRHRKRASDATRRRHGPMALALGAVAAFGVGLLVWERRSPARRPEQPVTRRGARNVAIAATGSAVWAGALSPVVARAAKLGQRKGLLPRLGLPSWAETVAGLLVLDYMLYVWHVLLHRVPLLWRFHEVHHADRELDVLTAARFHGGETLLSIPFHAGVATLFGIPPRCLRAFTVLSGASILFHHSNVRLSTTVQQRLARIITTPRLHAIHHAENATFRDSNWSSGLTLWDRLHGTLTDDTKGRRVVIGLPCVGADDDRASAMLTWPFR